eukprot:Plantae.Rhodophyta-Purpureofilum_apyrenoidigerum.ctg25499.p1 GENE.Plantae.Rhodophyta-Purpureofilum_apyrenoidigerum.ctg25499~~Plantae.Rhodophyta-Purpureofilum_apyrenoidigerum.ctg25499.p1  ORF type:complete len:161 (-),score=34.28 Plantae.Rhodophyta-Purpureofilum_apyrenoidigerum.ctg25499:443-925(-)
MTKPSETFRPRLSKLYELWRKDKAFFNGVDSLGIITGKDEDIGYYKSYALFTWLFGDEIQGMLFFASEKAVKIICEPQDLNQVQKLIDIEVKNSSHPKIVVSAYKKGSVKDSITDIGKSIGFLVKEQHSGDLVGEFSRLLDSSKIEKVEGSRRCKRGGLV